MRFTAFNIAIPGFYGVQEGFYEKNVGLYGVH
jgi:hypothetical protein